MIRTFGRGGRYYGRGYKSQGRPPYSASAEVARALTSKSGESKSSSVSSDGSLAENGVMVKEKPVPQMNGGAGDTRSPSHSESALNNGSKMANTDPHLMY